MRIKLGEISEIGLEVKAELSDAWAREAVQLAVEAEPIELTLEARVQRVSDCVRIHGRLRASAERHCDRCQQALRVDLEGEVDLYYAPPRPGEGGDRDLDPGDLDIGWFDGEGLEISQVISEQLAIWCPDQVHCSSAPCSRLTPSDAPCEVPDHDGGPELERHSPFANLRLPE